MGGSRFKYSEQDMFDALNAVKNGLSIRLACTKFKVPRSTLQDKLKGKTPLDRMVGRHTILSKNEEIALTEWITRSSQQNFPVTKTNLLDSVQMLLKASKRNTVFTDGRPGRHWYEAFQRRHPEVTQIITDSINYNKATVNEIKIEDWFSEVESRLRPLNLIDVKPDRVFNCEEIAFFLDPKDNSVVAKKDAMSVSSSSSTNDKKEHLVTLVGGNAAGEMVPPMVLFPYKRLPCEVTKNFVPGWGLGKSSEGWCTSYSFYNYIADVFYPWLLQKKVSFPVVLYVSIHTCHVTQLLSDFCVKKQIELVPLHPCTTHILQPVDVTLCPALKESWKKTVEEWLAENEGKRILKEEFARVLKKCLDSLNFEEIMKNGFCEGGLYPFSLSNIDWSIEMAYIFPTLMDVEMKTEVHTDDEFRTTIAVLESHLNSDLMKEFQEAEFRESWNGEPQHTSLFQFWFKLKKQLREAT